jgi:hypothetical protein
MGASGTLQVLSALVAARHGDGVGRALALGGSTAAQAGLMLPNPRAQGSEASIGRPTTDGEGGLRPALPINTIRPRTRHSGTVQPSRFLLGCQASL